MPAPTPQGPAAPPVDVLYVGGMPRSGSTLTDLMLDGLPGHVAVGELFYLWRNGVAHDGLCSCSQRFSQCAFWQQVGEAAFGGWDQVDVHRVMALQEQVDRSSRVPLLLAPRRPAAFEAALREYTRTLAQLYRAIREVSGARVVVDSSKRPSLAFVLRGMPEVRMTVAHVLRDPRGVAFSFAKHVDLPPGAALGAQMPRSSTAKVARRWVTVNAMISMLALTGTPLVRVRYEDLVASPRAELARVSVAEGGPADPELPGLTEGGVVVPRTHAVAGGRIRLGGGTMALRLDDAWRTQMPAPARRLVAALTAPARAAYGYR